MQNKIEFEMPVTVVALPAMKAKVLKGQKGLETNFDPTSLEKHEKTSG